LDGWTLDYFIGCPRAVGYSGDSASNLYLNLYKLLYHSSVLNHSTCQQQSVMIVVGVQVNDASLDVTHHESESDRVDHQIRPLNMT